MPGSLWNLCRIQSRWQPDFILMIHVPSAGKNLFPQQNLSILCCVGGEGPLTIIVWGTGPTRTWSLPKTHSVAAGPSPLCLPRAPPCRCILSKMRNRDGSTQDAFESSPSVPRSTLQDGVFCEQLAGFGSPGTSSGFQE